MNENSTCAVWGTPATERHAPERDGRCIESARTGGAYWVTRTAETVLQECDDRQKARLTTWLVRQRRLGTLYPEITSKTVDDAKNGRNQSISDRADNILRYLETKSEIVGTQIDYSIHISFYEEVQLDDHEITYLELLSHSECVGRNDLFFLISSLKERGLIEFDGSVNDVGACMLTVEGYAKLAELENTYKVSSRAFVAMWFDASMNEAWERGFEPAMHEAGYDPVRIDREEHVNKIDDQIIAEIRRARFVVADFTQGDDGARGGVYYEAGFAHGLNVPVIFTCHNNSLDKLHFDTRQYNHVVWSDPEELRERLVNRIAAVVGDGPNKS